MENQRLLSLLVLAASLSFVSAPFWSGEFGGFDPNLYPNPQDEPPAQPAGYAFSIWGVIYLWLVVSAGFGVFARADDPTWAPVRLPLLGSLAIGTFWLLVAQSQPVAATVMIWAMLGLALLALLRAPRTDLWWLAAPIGLYAGWLTAASSVSLALTGAGYGLWFGELSWAYIILSVALLIGGTVQAMKPGVLTYGFAICWAIVAVFVANASDAPALAYTALAAAGLFAAFALTVYRRAA